MFGRIVPRNEIRWDGMAEHFVPLRDQGSAEFGNRYRTDDGFFRGPALNARMSHIPIEGLFLIDPRVARLQGIPGRRYVLGGAGSPACDQPGNDCKRATAP